MNPAGFLFGPDATVNVGGMMTFTTADYLRLSNEDGTKAGVFYAALTGPNLLTAAPIAAFGFLGSNPAPITVQGSKLEGTSISLVGGNITIESGIPSSGTAQRAKLSAPNGTIQLASATSPGAFDTTLQAIPNVNRASFTSFGTVSLAPGSTINVSGTDTVSIRGGQFVLNVNDAVLHTGASSAASNSISLHPGSSIISSNASSGPGADIQIAAAELRTHQTQLTSNTTGQGDAGSVNIYAQNLIHTTESFISSSTTSTAVNAGSGGHITLTAPSVEMYGSSLSSGTLGSGNAGNITVQTSRLTLSASDGTGAEINASTSGPGRGGNISIQGVTGSGSRANIVSLSDFSSLLSETLDSRGDAGSIAVATVQLMLTKGSEITTASRRSIGNAGSITLDATESIALSGSFVKSNVLEQSTGDGGSIAITTKLLTVGTGTEERGGLISTGTTALGKAGSITINAEQVVLTDGGRLSSSSAHEDSILPPPDGAAGTVLVQGVNGPGTRARSIVISRQDGFQQSSGIFSDTQGTGIGGDITLHADSVTIQNGGKLSVETSGTRASAIGGTITVHADHMQLHSGANITADSNGVANAGNINIIATDGLTMQNSSITTLIHPNKNGSNAGGGDIQITTSPAATVYLHDNSTISASVADGPGGGGNVTIDPQYVIMQGSRILAQADQGTGGNITIIANVFQPDATSIVTADAGRGVNGTVTIQSPNAPISGKIQPLGNQPLQAATLFTQRCAAVTGGTFSSFMVTGRETLPIEPGGWLSSPSASTISLFPDGTMPDSDSRNNRAVARGDVPFLSIRRFSPTQLLARAFVVGTQAGCRL